MEDWVNPRCVQNSFQACLSLCPQPVHPYIETRLDSTPKVLTHLLVLMAICNFFLFLCSWSISYLVFFASLLLNAQTVCVILVVNNDGRLSFAPRFLSPNDFIVGVCLGISIGGAILSLFLSAAFRQTRRLCNSVGEEQHLAALQMCELKHTSITAVWFWSTALFWLNAIACILLAASRHEIAALKNYQYESIGIDEVREIHDAHASRINGNGSINQLDQNGENGGTFVGDYGKVPDVRTSML